MDTPNKQDQCTLSTHSQKSAGFDPRLQSPIKLFTTMPCATSWKQLAAVKGGVDVTNDRQGR